MSESADLGTADLRALLDVIDAARADDPGPAIPWMVLDGLRQLIPCREVVFASFDLTNRRFDAVQASHDYEGYTFGNGGLAADSVWWTELPRFHRQYWSDVPPGRARRMSARVTPEQLRRSPLFEEFWEGVTDSVGLNLQAGPGCGRGLSLWRDDHDLFTARDEALLNLLLPHLIEIDRNARRRRAGVPELTPREWQVLQLAAEGHSNTEIAQVLVISVHTVRKHLEHIYAHTGAQSRSAAVAKMMPLRG